MLTIANHKVEEYDHIIGISYFEHDESIVIIILMTFYHNINKFYNRNPRKKCFIYNYIKLYIFIYINIKNYI